ncbi:MAG: ChbG/HpnK family deacetylase [bacterium]|nr:ChbG/HpnK family deacetylase [bacterium]
MKKLIVNADDFGLSKSVNRGIIDCYQKGIVTSTTLMPNMPGFDEAVLLAKQNPGLGVGCHLNIYRGRPVLKACEIPSLVNKNGLFFASSELVKRIYWRRIKASEVRREFSAQIQKIQGAGIEISHLDSEKHFHCFPIISPIVAELARDFGILKVRLPREKWKIKKMSQIFSPQLYKMEYLALRSRFLAKSFQKFDIKFVDNFSGILYSGKLDQDLLFGFIETIPDGISELMVHPAYVDQELEQLADSLNIHLLESREQELRALTSPEIIQKVKELNIELVSYREL